MDRLIIERTGGPGGTGARMRGHGEVDFSALSPGDRARLKALFDRPGPLPEPTHGNYHFYTLTWRSAAGERTVKAQTGMVPASIDAFVTDELI